MHAALARVVTPLLTYHPANAFENTDAHEVYLDAKDGTRLRTMADASVAMADPDARMAFNVNRAWWVQGTVDGEPETWLVLAVGGCGCGSTGTMPTAGEYADWLQLSPETV